MEMSASRYTDLADRIEVAVRRYVIAKMPPDPSTELAGKPFRDLLHTYYNWRGRVPFARPRTVHQSKEMLASAEAQTFSTEIAELVRKMEAGEGLKPHLSENVDTAFLSVRERAALPQHKQEKNLDRMLADWGVYHLHLSNQLKPNGFVRRGNELLFAVFTRDDAYLVGIYTHADWSREELAPIIIRNWPGVGPFYKLNYAQGPAHVPAEEERKLARKQGASSGFVEVDGEWYGVLGQTGAGMPSPHTQPVMALGEKLRLLREDPEGQLAEFADVLDEKAGHAVTGDWSPYAEDDIVGLRRGDHVFALAVLPGES